MIYLASPYTDPDPDVRIDRFKTVCLAAALLMEAGEHVYSPIAHTHPIAVAGELPKGWDFWEKYDRWYLTRVDRIIVLTIDGWDRSKGVLAEIEIAKELGKPIEYVTMDQLLKRKAVV